MRHLIIPIAALVLLAGLGFFAFKSGFDTTPTGNLVVQDASFMAYINMDAYEIDVEFKNVSINNNRVGGTLNNIEIDAQAPVWLYDFSGKIKTEGSTAYITGKTRHFVAIRMSLMDDSGIPVSLKFSGGGSFEINELELEKFRTKASGELTLTDKVKIGLDKTPITITGFKGLIRNDLGETSMVTIQGNAENLEVREDNFLEKIQQT